MSNSVKNDLIAGFCVFLLALPLCLGIASLSNFPPIAGILSAIIGGLLCSLFGGAQLAIKGPAAGLVVIVLNSVHQLGAGDLYLGYKRTLAVGVIAGIIQIIIGMLRKAIIAEIIPPFVIHGMLAAIGVIIVSKQSYVLMGISPTVSNPIELILQLPQNLLEANPLILIMGLISLAIVFFWPKIKKISFIPASIVILLCIIPLSIYFDLNTKEQYIFLGKSYALGKEFFINLPTQFFDAIQFPDFSLIFSLISIKYIFMFVLIGSIESLLTVCAIDALVSQKTPSDLNKDLCIIGFGNLVSSFVGGLPMISEIVRSKANIDYGATSIRSNFIHGLLMLVAILLFPKFMNSIPLSSLAALLIFVGIKLTSPKEFIHAYQVGKDQFIIFLTTFFVTLATDLLMGVMAGILAKFILHVYRGNDLRKLLYPIITIEKFNESTRIKIEGSLTFISYLRLKNIITKASIDSKTIFIDLKAVTFLDHTVLNKLLNLNKEFHNVMITIEENQELVPFNIHPLSAKRKPF